MATNTKEESKISEKNQPKSKKMKSQIFSTQNSGRNLSKPTLKSRRLKQLVTKTKKLQRNSSKVTMNAKDDSKIYEKIHLESNKIKGMKKKVASTRNGGKILRKHTT